MKIILILILVFSLLQPSKNDCITISLPTIEQGLKSSQINVIEAIAHIESSGDSTALNEKENAVGYLQIRPCMLREANRLVGYEKYQLSDRISKSKSIQLFCDIQRNYNPSWDLEVAARKWNGGYKGMQNPKTLKYYKLVKIRYNERFRTS